MANDGAKALIFLFGAAFIWNSIKGKSSTIKRNGFYFPYRRPYTGPRERVMGGPQGFKPISENGAGSDEPSTPGDQKGGTLGFTGKTATGGLDTTSARRKDRRSLTPRAPKPIPRPSFGGLGGGGAGVRSAEIQRVMGGPQGFRRSRILAPKPRDPGVLPSGTTAGYAEYGQVEAMR